MKDTYLPIALMGGRRPIYGARERGPSENLLPGGKSHLFSDQGRRGQREASGCLGEFMSRFGTEQGPGQWLNGQKP